MQIPDRIPSVFFDRLVLAMEISGAGRFIVQLEMDFRASLDPERLEKALGLMLDAEPVLGCRLVCDPKLPYWQRLSAAERKNFSFTANESDYLAFRHESLDYSKGPQLQACLLRNGQGDRLLLKVAHQASDAGGVKNITEKLSSIYNRLEKEPRYKPEPNLAGCREFSQIMHHVPFWAYPVIFINFLSQSWSNAFPASTLQLPIPQGPAAPFTYVVKHLPARRLEKIRQFGKARGATINDVLVAAYYWALVREAGWDQKAMLRLQTTIDLRRWYLPDDKDGGICNLSAYEYPNLDRVLGRDFGETVELVSRKKKSRKKNWVGLTDVCLMPLLNLMSFEKQEKLAVKAMNSLIKRKSFPNALTNMGEIKKQSVTFGMEPERACLLTPFIYPPLFGGGVSVYDGELTFCGGVPVHAGETIDRFYQAVIDHLPE